MSDKNEALQANEIFFELFPIAVAGRLESLGFSNDVMLSNKFSVTN
jgi:hypothetical protein